MNVCVSCVLLFSVYELVNKKLHTCCQVHVHVYISSHVTQIFVRLIYAARTVHCQNNVWFS